MTDPDWQYVGGQQCKGSCVVGTSRRLEQTGGGESRNGKLGREKGEKGTERESKTKEIK